VSFAEEFKHETPILRAALEAAVGPLPDAELLGLGRIRVVDTMGGGYRYLDPLPGVILAEARALLAGYVQACRTLVKVDHVDITPEGLKVSGRIPDVDIARMIQGDPLHVSLASRLAGPPRHDDIQDDATPADDPEAARQAQAALSVHYLAQLLENDPDLEQADLHGMLTRAILVGRGDVIYATARVVIDRG
jgi:hypothetical protein